MYEPLLIVHSWTRWIVLLSAAYFFGVCAVGFWRKRNWSGAEAHFVWAFDQVFLFQALFGMALWIGASPIVHAAFLDPRAILENPSMQFWSVRHPATMIVALVVFQIGKNVANKRPVADRHAIFAITFGTVLALITSAIPWPFLSYGRALIRLWG